MNTLFELAKNHVAEQELETDDLNRTAQNSYTAGYLQCANDIGEAAAKDPTLSGEQLIARIQSFVTTEDEPVQPPSREAAA